MRKLGLALSGILLLVLLPIVLYSQRGLPAAGTGWVAKRVCSGVFVAGRAQETLVGASLPLPVPVDIPAEVDLPNRRVIARIESPFLPEAPSVARFREGFGCTLEGPGDRSSPLDALDGAVLTRKEEPERLPERIAKNPELDRALDFAFERPEEASADRETGEQDGQSTRAVVVLQDGGIVAERYSEGFSASTRLPGWSMAKSVTSAIVGLLVDAGRIDRSARVGLDEWSSPGDPRAAITWDQLLRMSSGLSFDEDYSLPSSDAIQMLFGLERFAKGRYAALRPLEFEPDTHWNYSSGTSNLLQYALLTRVFEGDLAAYLAFPHRALFGRIGMSSAVLEPDARGGYVGSSFLYATARDWARFGQLFLDEGEWQGQRILSREWAEYSATPTPTEPGGTYGAHWWLNANPETGSRRMPRLDPDILIASGFEGQYVVIVPKQDLVVVRLGLDRGTPLDIESLVAGIVDALAGPLAQ